MSEYIDERIVSIKFDNSGFAEGVSETQKSLDDLNKSLTFDGAAEGGKELAKTFKDISTEAKKADLSPLGDAVGAVQEKFSALGEIARGVFLKIGMDAVEMGKKLIKSVSIDPISQGFDKYQKILTSQMALTAALGGETEAEIDKNAKKIRSALDLVTRYADETSYSLTDMTDNISKFVNYGVDLEDAARAMMGIGNASAKSGEPLWKATHAMEAFSKAMGQGYMSYQIWNNQIKTAGIGTMDFKNTMIETAKEFLRSGAVINDTVRLNGDSLEFYKSKAEGWISVNEQWNDSLTKGKWLTTNVMLAGLAKYSASIEDVFNMADQLNVGVTEILDSGSEAFDKFSTEALMYAQQSKTLEDVTSSLFDAITTTWGGIFESIIGDYKQTVDLWSQFAEYVFEWFVYPLQEVAEAIKKFSQSNSRILDETGKQYLTMREVIVGSFMNILEAISSVIKPIKEAFNAVFKPFETLPGIIQNGTEKFYNFTKSLILTEEKSDKLRGTFVTIFSVIQKIWTIITTVAKTIKDTLYPIVKKVSEFIINILEVVAKGIFNILSSISTFVSKVFGITDVMANVKEAMLDIARNIDAVNKSINESGDSTDNIRAKIDANKASFTSYNDVMQDFIDKQNEATKSQKGLNEELEYTKRILPSKDDEGTSEFLTYKQAADFNNDRVLAEFIKANNITEKQYDAIVDIVKHHQDSSADFEEISRSLGDQSADTYKNLARLLNNSISLVDQLKHYSAQIQDENSNGDEFVKAYEPVKETAVIWTDILTGIEYAVDGLNLSVGDSRAILDLYFNQAIKDYSKIADAVGIEEYKIRTLIEAYEEAYAVENRLKSKRLEATQDNINLMRVELGYVTKKEVGLEEATQNSVKRASIEERNARIQERNERLHISSTKTAKQYSHVVSDLITKTEGYGDELANTNKNLSKTEEMSKSVVGSIQLISDSTKKASESVDNSATVMAGAFRNIGNSSKEASDEVDKNVGNIKEKAEEASKSLTFEESLNEFFEGDVSDNPIVSKFSEIFNALRIAGETFKEDFTGFFTDPLSSIESSVETIKGLFSTLKEIIFGPDKSEEEAGVLDLSENLDKTEKDSKGIIDRIIDAVKKIREQLKEPLSWTEFFNLGILNHEMKILADVLNKFGESLNIEGMGDDILKVAEGIVLLVGALYLMSLLDNGALNDALDIFDRLCGVLTLVAGAFTFFMSVLNIAKFSSIPSAIGNTLTKVFGGKSEMEDIANLIKEFAKGIAILVASLVVLALALDHVKNPESIAAAIGIITGFMVALLGLVVIIEIFQKNVPASGAKINIGTINKTSGSISDIIGEFAKAIAILALAFIGLTLVIDKYFYDEGSFDIEKFVLVSSMLVVMIAIIIAIAGIMTKFEKEISKTGLNNKQIKSISKSLSPVMVALGELILAYFAITKIIESVGNPDIINQANEILITMVGGLLLVIIVLAALSDYLTHGGGSLSKDLVPYGSSAGSSKDPIGAIKELAKVFPIVASSILIIGLGLAAVYSSMAVAGPNANFSAVGGIFLALVGEFALIIAELAIIAYKLDVTQIQAIGYMSKALVLIGTSITIIAAGLAIIFASMSLAPEGTNFTGVALAFALIIGVFGAMIAAIALVAKDMTPDDLEAISTIAGATLLIGTSITIIAAGLAIIFASMSLAPEGTNFTGVALAFALIIGVFAVLVAAVALAASKMTPEDIASIKALSVSIVIISAAILIIALGLAAVCLACGQAPDGDCDCAWALVAMVGALAIMVGEMAVIAKKLTPQDIKEVNALGLAVIEIAAAVLIISFAISNLCESLSGVDPEVAKTAITTIEVIFGVLIGLFGLIALLIAATGGSGGKGMEAMKGAAEIMILLGVGLAAIAASVWILAEGLKAMVEALKAVAAANEDLIAGLEVIRDSLPILKDIIIGIVDAIVVGIIQAIVKCIADIAKAIVEGFVTILETLNQNLPKIRQLIEQMGPEIEATVQAILDILFNLLETNLPRIEDILDQLFQFVLSLLSQLLQWVQDELVPGLINVIDQLLQYILDTVVPALQDAMVNMLEWLDTDFIPALLNVLDTLWNGVVDFITETVFPGLEKLWSDLIELIIKLVDDLIKGLRDAVDTWGHDIIDVIVALIDVINDGIQDILHALERLMINLADGLLEFFETGGSVLAKLLLIPLKIWEGFSKEIKKQFGIDDSGKAISGSGIFEIGKAIIQALIDGLTALGTAIGNAAKFIWDKFASVFKKESKEKSPSKETEQMGKYLGEGLVNGIKASAKGVGNAAKNMASAALDPLSGSISSFADIGKMLVDQLANADMDFEPVIAPVFDMSNLEEAKKSMDGMLDVKGAFDLSTISGNFSGFKNFQFGALGGDQNGGNSSDGSSMFGNTVNFTQNNYSPKALSAAEIYRRTSGQLNFDSSFGF